MKGYYVITKYADARAVKKGKIGKRIIRKVVYRKVGKWLR